MGTALGNIKKTVPAGYNMIVRQIILTPSDVLVDVDTFGATPVEYLMSLSTNGAGVVENTDFPVFLLAGENVFDVFFTALENAVIQVSLSVTTDLYTLAGEGQNVTINIVGNLLLSDNRPDNMIVSTEVG